MKIGIELCDLRNFSIGLYVGESLDENEEECLLIGFGFLLFEINIVFY